METLFKLSGYFLQLGVRNEVGGNSSLRNYLKGCSNDFDKR